MQNFKEPHQCLVEITSNQCCGSGSVSGSGSFGSVPMFLDLLDPDQLVRGMDPNPDPDPLVVARIRGYRSGSGSTPTCYGFATLPQMVMSCHIQGTFCQMLRLALWAEPGWWLARPTAQTLSSLSRVRGIHTARP
jgi:hypothetical protein